MLEYMVAKIAIAIAIAALFALVILTIIVVINGWLNLIGFPHILAELKAVWKRTKSVRAVLTEPVGESDWERLAKGIKNWLNR